MHDRDDNEAVVTTHPAQFREESLHVAHMVEDQTRDHAVEGSRFEGQRPRSVLVDESHRAGARFRTRLSEHPFREVDAGDAGSRRRKSHRVTSRPAAHIEKIEAAHVAESAFHLGRFDDDQRIQLVVIDLRPAVVTFLRGDDEVFCGHEGFLSRGCLPSEKVLDWPHFVHSLPNQRNTR